MFGIRKAPLALRLLVALATMLIAAPVFAAESSCARWDVSGHWTLIQSNDTAVSVTLEQTKTGLSGEASFGRWVKDSFFLCNIASCGEDYVGAFGPAVGTLNGDDFELTVYWSNNAIGLYTGKIGPQGLIVGTTVDKNDPRTTAQWHSSSVVRCSVAADTTPPPSGKPAVQLGRVPSNGTPSPSMSICDAAKSARARNSPAAPGLERQCAAQPPAAAPTVAFARPQTPGPMPAICDAAKSARARNSPAAPGLERQCNASLAANHAPAPAPAPVSGPAERGPPVERPNDLVIGRITFAQGGRRVTQPIVGTPVAISCTYAVNEVASPFASKIQPWRGSIYIGGAAPQTFGFQGEPAGGQHEARQTWTPAAAGRTLVSCVLNPGFDGAEANSGNNRWDETISVVADDDAGPPGKKIQPAQPEE